VGIPRFERTLRAGVIEKRCKGTAFYGDVQINAAKSVKFPQIE